MTPDFALNYSEFGISLLKRATDGWTLIGSVQLDAPDLSAELAALRERAEVIAAPGFPTKLILPTEYVFYFSAPPGEYDTDAIADYVRTHSHISPETAAMDWCSAEDSVQIAVVGKDTLAEGERFALEHGFNPVSFAAVPEMHEFPTEPYFGVTAHAAHLASDPKFQGRDPAPVIVKKDSEEEALAQTLLAASPPAMAHRRPLRSWLGPRIALGLSVVALLAAAWVTEFPSDFLPAPDRQAAVDQSPDIEPSISHGTDGAAPKPAADPEQVAEPSPQVEITEATETAEPEEPVTDIAEQPEQVAEPTPQVEITEATETAEPEEPVTNIAEQPEQDGIQLTNLSTKDIFEQTGAWTAAPGSGAAPAPGMIYDLHLPTLHTPPLSLDAVAMARPLRDPGQDQPFDPGSPAPAGTTFARDADGLVIPTEEGTLTPNNVRVVAGQPSFKPEPRPVTVALIAPATDPAVMAILATIRPTPRPEDLIERHERANFGGLTLAELAERRPAPRPPSPQDNPEISPDPTAQAIDVSLLPKERPDKFYDEVVAPVLASRAPDPDDTNESDTPSGGAQIARGQGPSIPTTASVAREATQENMVNMRRLILIGTYGTSSNRRAIVRMPSGRYRTIEVGDRLDGGRVLAINSSEVVYQKGSRNITLELPPT